MGLSSDIKRQVFRNYDIGEKVCTFLRARYPERTVDNVVADLSVWDIKHATIAKMLERRTSPGTILWLALIWAYGPEFLSEVHPAPMHWLNSAARAEKQLELESKLDALRVEMERLR